MVAAISVSAVEIISLEKEKAQLATEQAELKKELEAAKDELANTDDPDYIEQQVREAGGVAGESAENTVDDGAEE